MAGQNFAPGSAAVPSSQVEISVSCRNLRDKDTFSKSDPICVLFLWDPRGRMYHEHGRTEMIKNNLNPDFVQKFVMQYFFEESQKLKFELYDIDSPQARLDAHDFLGRLECTLGEIVGCCSGRLEKNLIGVQGASKIIVRVEELTECKEVVTIQFRGAGLDKKDFFGKSDPFLIIKKANDLDKSFTAVHKTEVIKNTLNPTWAPIRLTARALCNGDHKRLLRIECYDWDSDGGHDTIGALTTTLKDLADGAKSGQMFDVINEHKKAKKRNYKNSGELNVMSCKIEIVPTFLDFLKGGMEMNFTVAIDFTASNGNPSQPNSLHYLSQNSLNQYATTIQAVGEIIQDYDTDKLFPVLGFGARLPDGTVSHEFPCNLNPQNPYCAGLQGIMQAYYTSIRQVQLYGPTNFSPVINHVGKFASAKTDGSNYFVLLIITDGVISDMPHTIQSIVQVSSLPMSIIIVGVGDADFDAMDVLDADGKRLGIEGRYAERDIVQTYKFVATLHTMCDILPALSALSRAFQTREGAFTMVNSFVNGRIATLKTLCTYPGEHTRNLPSLVADLVPKREATHFVPIRDFLARGHGDVNVSKAALAKAVLAEVPDQVVDYMRRRHVQPKPPRVVPPSQQQSNVAPTAPTGAPNPPGQTPYQEGGVNPSQPPYPNNAGQNPGQGPPYPGAAPPSQAPYPGQGQGQGQAPYPAPGQGQGGQGQAPYPAPGQGQGGQGQAPYPAPGQGQGGQGQAPYPAPRQGQGGQGQAPYPAPRQGQGGQGQAPYPAPGQGQGGQGQAPYPGPGQGQGGQGQAPYPAPGQGQGGQGQAPYPAPGQGQGGQGQAPYPAPRQGQGGQGQAPYPAPRQGQGGQGQAPYPAPGQGQGGQGQAPYPAPGQGQGGQGQAPYPTGGQAPYPMSGPGMGQSQPGQGSASYSTPGQGQGQTPYPAQGQGSAPYPAPGQGQGTAPYPSPGQGQGMAPYPTGQPPYPTAGPGQGQQQKVPPQRPPPPSYNTTI